MKKKRTSIGMSKKEDFRKGDQKRDSKLQRINNILPFLLVLFSAFLTILAYLRSLNGPLILDDFIFIDPQRLKDVSRHLFLGFRKVAEVSFSLNYMVSGMDPTWFRVTNIALHILTAILIFYLTHFTLNMPSMKDRFGKGSVMVSSAVAVLFMLHPIQTSAVNYITQRMAIMAAMFSFLGLLMYAKAALTGGRKSVVYYVLSAISFLFAIFSKENAVMVLLIIPIYDLIFISSFRWKELRNRLIPLTLLALILLLAVSYKMPILDTFKQLITIYLNPHKPLGSYAWGGIDIRWTPIEYLLTELRVVSRYILLILFPSPSFMVFDYSNAYPVSKSLFSPVSTFFSLIFLVSLLLLSLRYIKKFPVACFGIIWYSITISLESFIGMGLDPYFEHRNYLPIFGIFLCLSSLLTYIDKSKFKSEVIISVVATILFLLTFTRNGTWENNETLWKDTAEKVPENRRAIQNLSAVLIREGRYREAEGYLVNALKVQPLTSISKCQILFNLATIYKETNRIQEAKVILNELLSEEYLRETDKGALYFLIGVIFMREDNLHDARRYLEEAYKIKPDNPETLTYLGAAKLISGDIEGAEKFLLRSLEIEPKNALGHLVLGDVYMVNKDINKAEKYYTQAITMGSALPRDMAKKSIVNLAQINLMKGDVNKAIIQFKRVIDIDPAFYPPYVFLGDIYLKMGDAESAIKNLEKALSLKETFAKNDPNAVLLYYNLGKAYIIKGDKEKGRKNLGIFLSKATSDRRLQDTVAKAKRELAVLK